MAVVKIIIFIVLAVVVSHFIRFIRVMGFHKSVNSHAPGPCHHVKNIDHGSEDIQILHDGLALVTSGMRFSEHEVSNVEYKDFKGQLYLVDMKNPQGGATPATIEGAIDLNTLNPHGLSVHTNKATGEITVLVVNHPIGQEDDSIEKFTWDKKRKVLQHKKTIQSEAFRVLNDISAIDGERFYVTNSIYYKHLWMRVVETVTGRSWGSVVYCHKDQCKVAADGISMPNGINLSPDNKYVYVAASFGEALQIYKQNTDNTLSLVKEHPLNMVPDNIDVDAEGDVWVTGHPVPWQMMRQLTAPTKLTAPSQVLRLRIKDTEVTEVEEVFADDNKRLSSSSIATRYNKGLLIGTVAHKLMYCEINHMES